MGGSDLSELDEAGAGLVLGVGVAGGRWRGHNYGDLLVGWGHGVRNLAL